MANVFSNLDWSLITTALLRLVPALLCMTIHELSHGFVAYRLGDNTAKQMGRLTLNPIRHIDPMGLFMMVVFRFGWAKPVPVNMRNFENPKRGMALTALAGPVSNFILAIVVLVIYGVVYAFMPQNSGNGWATATDLIINIAWLSIALGVFNLIPIPPLDGSKVIFSVLSDSLYMKLMRVEKYGMVILMIVVWAGLLSDKLSVATMWVYEHLFAISEGVYKLVSGVING